MSWRSSQRRDDAVRRLPARSGGEQLLRAEEITLAADANELQATGNAFISLVDPPSEDRGRDRARTVLLTGRQLLVDPAHVIFRVI